MSIFLLYLELKLLFGHIIACDISECMSLLEWKTCLLEMDQSFNFGGTIGCGDSYIEFQFYRLKVFRLHAILHDAAGAVRAHGAKNPGYCYVSGRGSNLCRLGHVTGLLFCL